MQLRAGALVAIPAGWEPDRYALRITWVSRSDVEWGRDVLSGISTHSPHGTEGESALCVGIVGDMYRLSVLERGDYQARSQEGKWPKSSIDP